MSRRVRSRFGREVVALRDYNSLRDFSQPTAEHVAATNEANQGSLEEEESIADGFPANDGNEVDELFSITSVIGPRYTSSRYAAFGPNNDL